MLYLLLAEEEGFDIVGEAADGLQTVAVVGDLQPDVLLLNLVIPGMDGTEVIKQIKQTSPHTKLLMITAFPDESMIFNALKAGARGYLSQEACVSDLIKAIHAVHQGELWVERKLLARFFEGEAWAHVREEDAQGQTNRKLTARELEILRLLASGDTNKEMAQALFISEKTIKSHLNSMFRKLNVTRRAHAILYAVQQGLS